MTASVHGRRVCAWCHEDRGEAPGIPAGEETSTICPPCEAGILQTLAQVHGVCDECGRSHCRGYYKPDGDHVLAF